ncbi:MAG: prepilin-type N-terminal cleavage/methylation domain-containing protein [Lachnospiraceae bacterium]|nr:prepilin-type N-terminal cleavage/methylation domain-containing protein [Lachnospiraceae bacterium]
MRKNQKGFTLVELIIAVAILAIVTLAVCGFIVVGSRSYTSANTDIMLQQEAQLALNQISDVIIDTTDSINYGNGTDLVLKDSEFSGEPDQKILVVVNKKDGNNDNDSYRFEWSKDTETIYFNTSDTVIDDANPEPVFDDANRAILAQHVRELHIDISQFEENRVVMISMTFENGNREYTTSNNVTVRNRVALNKIDIDPMKKAEEFTITTVKSVVLEPNDTYSLPFTVDSTAADEDAKDVKWEMVGGPMNGSSISEDGRLTIGREEKRESFTVRVYRVKEEYANQNDKVAKTVKVRIKRANTVNLSCSATTIKAGSTVTVNGSAAGYLLGSQCNGEGCATDDLTKDHDLVTAISAEGWRIVQGPATVETADSGKAEIKILSTAKKGDTIEIEARASLPDRKGYGPVTGRLTLKVTEGNNGAKFIGSDLKFGTDNDPGIFDYMRSHLGTDHGRYVFCIRVREAGTNDVDNDWVMLYYTMAANERFLPDIFGLDHTKTYEIYFQILDPRPKGSREEASKEEITEEYLGNLDDSGKYIGTKFEADEYYYAIINPPNVGVEVDGVKYPNEDTNDRDRYVHFIIQGNNGVGGPILGGIKPQTAINIDFNTILNEMAYTAYKEDENGNWIRVYGVGFDDAPSVSQRTGIERIGELNPNVAKQRVYTGQREFGDIVFENFGSSMTIKRNGSSNPQEACGIYHIVPGFVYTNNLYIREGYYAKEETVIYKKAPDDYNTYYYKQWDSVINVKIDMGLNLQLPTVNGEERWTNFPTPSDRAFPFDLRSDTKQEMSYDFTSYTKDGQWREEMKNVTVTCEYNGQRDVYLITLSSMEIKGRQVITHIYGKYESSMGQGDWIRVALEDTKVENIQTNLTFTKDDKVYEAYFPSPSDADFPKSAFDSNSPVNNWQLISFRQDGSPDALVERCIVNCSKSGSQYQIEIIRETPTGNPHKVISYNYGTFEWNSGSGTWRQTVPGSNTGEEKAVWGTCLEFQYNGNTCKLEAPLPSEEGFPDFSGSYNESVTQYFPSDDEYGERGQNSWGGIKKEYTYDVNTDTYTLKLVNGYNSSEVYGTWTCTSNGKEWIKQ